MCNTGMEKWLKAAAFVMAAASLMACSKELGQRDGGVSGDSSRVRIIPNVMSATGLTRAADGCGIEEKVSEWGSADDGFMITEYVGDIDAQAPLTKGQEIVDGKPSTEKGYNISQNGSAFGILAYYDATGTKQPIPEKGLDIEGKCVYTSSWGWSSDTKQFTTTFTNGVPSNSMETTVPPCWRVKAKEHFWSIYPAVAPGRASSTGDFTELENLIDPAAPASFAFDYEVSTVLEDQQDLLFAYNYEDKSGASNWEKLTPAANDKEWVPSSSFDNSVDITFGHALSAVKFQLSSTTDGANVHSITICYVDASGNIVKNVGVARSGECTVTGSSSGIGFSWGDLDTKRPLHYKYTDAYPATTATVAGGYAKEGKGVMFMIPQTIPHTISTAGGTATLKIIVEFSKYGGTQDYHTVVKDFTSSDITWEAGKYYLYQISIGEFHVPGENLNLPDVNIPGLKNTAVITVPTTAVKIKGVSKVGLVLDNYRLGSKAGQTVYMHAIINETNLVSYSGNPVSPTTANSTFNFDFDPVGDDAIDPSGMIYEFGNGTTEGYSKYYYFDQRSGSSKSKLTEYNSGVSGPLYYVFETPGEGNKTFKIGFQPAAGDNSGGFAAAVRCLVVLEMTPDPNLPVNWDDFLANLSEYL